MSRIYGTVARSEDGMSVVTGRRPSTCLLLLSGQLPAPSREIPGGHQQSAFAQPTRCSRSPRLNAEDLAVAVDPRGISRTFVVGRDVSRDGIHRHPTRDEPEHFRGADWAAVGVVYLLAVETQTGNAEVHLSIITGRVIMSVPAHRDLHCGSGGTGRRASLRS